MRKSLIALFLAFVATTAFAVDKAAEGKIAAPASVAKPEPVVETVTPETPRVHKRKVKRLPRGDMRHCLELKGNAAIIKCAETRK
ncbi:MAG: hypothetical protein IPG66_06755 [Hydrogenophilales bacterium]|nr:hypothetical protein [Hydrogenophilales bacterium]